MPRGVVTDDENHEIDEINKDCLVKGLDDIGSTLERASYIDDYEERVSINYQWRSPEKG